MSSENKTANYKVIADAGGNCYRFICERSGLALCTTHPIRAQTPEEELRIAWKTEGRQHFNKCPHCSKWVSDLMFNVETSECVVCSPWEDAPNYCPQCGKKIPEGDSFCRKCGEKLQYKGEWRMSNTCKCDRTGERERYGFGTRGMEKVKVCPRCGVAAKASEQFCGECRAKLPEDNLFQSYNKQNCHCAVCDTIVCAKAQFCPKCGTQLKK